MGYQLSTEQQQLYLTAWITAIVTNLQYIDVEFSNQPVVIPLQEEFETNNYSTSIEQKDEIIPIKTKTLIEFKLPSTSIHRHDTTSTELQRLSSDRSRSDRGSMNANNVNETHESIFLQDNTYAPSIPLADN